MISYKEFVDILIEYGFIEPTDCYLGMGYSYVIPNYSDGYTNDTLQKMYNELFKNIKEV